MPNYNNFHFPGIVEKTNNKTPGFRFGSSPFRGAKVLKYSSCMLYCCVISLNGLKLLHNYGIEEYRCSDCNKLMVAMRLR